MSLTIYKKRSGTLDSGKEYEWLLCSFYSLLLTFSKKILDFDLYSNNQFFGDFDDVTLRVQFINNKPKVFLLQLKHKENTNTLAIKSLQSETGDYSILKYRKAYNQILSLDNFHFILFVNKIAKLKNGQKLKLKDEEVVVQETKCIGDDLLNTNKTPKCSVFQFDSNNNDLFFKKFYLYVNQQNHTNLKQSIAELLRNHLQTDIYNTFVEFMRCWWCGNFKITKSDIFAKITELIFSPMIQTLNTDFYNSKTELITQAIKQFDLTLIQEETNEKITKIWGNLPKNPNIKTISLTALKFGLTTKGINSFNELSLEKQAKVLWFMDQVPLLIKIDKSKEIQVETFLGVYQKQQVKKKLVLIGWNCDYRSLKVFKDLLDVEGDLLIKLRQSLSCSIQGKEAISLEKFGEINGFTVSQLLDISTNECLQIGENLESLPPVYIPRSFTKILLSYNVIDGLTKSKILLSCDGKKQQILNKFNKKLVDLSVRSRGRNFFKHHIFFCETEFTQEIIDKEFDSRQTCHHLRVIDSQNLQWLSSNEETNELEEFRKYNTDYNFKEDEINGNIHSKIKLLSAHTGTGKTSFFNRIKNQSLPNQFVIKMNLKDCDFSKKLTRGDLWNYIIESTGITRNYNRFEMNLFRNFNKNQIVILWDSFDDLNESDFGNFLEVVNELDSMKIQQWIASQNRFKKFLEFKLDVLALTFVRFTQEEQCYYIANRCGGSKTYLLDSFLENMKIIDNQEYLGVPLQLYILTEICSQEATLVDSIYTLTDMFAAFFDGTYKHFLQESGQILIKNFMNVIEENKSHRLDQYKLAAIKTHLPDLYDKLNLRNNINFLTDIKKGDYLGLIVKMKNEKFIFEYQILGEYFCALFLAENLTVLDDFLFCENHKNIRFMFDLLMASNQSTFLAILYKKFNNIQTNLIYDKAGRNPLHLICSYGQKHPVLVTTKDKERFIIENQTLTVCSDSKEFQEIVRKLSEIYNPYEQDGLFKWTSFDYAERSSSLGLIEYLGFKKLPNLRNYNLPSILYYSIKLNYEKIFQAIDQIPYVEDSNHSNLIHLAAELNRGKFLQQLMQHEIYKKFINRLNNDNWSALHFAIFNGNLDLVKFFMSNGATVMLREPSLMSLAASGGYKPIVELLLENGCSPNEFYHNNHYTTSLFQAIENNFRDVVELLIENGSKMYCVNRPRLNEPKPNPYGMNLFHMLVENEQFDEADLVLTKGIHIDSVGNEGGTAFHYAAFDDHERAVRYLLARGGNPKILNKLKQSPLHVAAKANSLKVAGILMEQGLDINGLDNEQTTPLHLAVLGGNTEFVEFLVKHQADLNLFTKTGRTAMHLAAFYDLADCLKVLFNSGADLQPKDFLYKRTPLHLAAWRGNDDCVEILLGFGAEIDGQCNYGYTPLHLAMEEANGGCCNILLKNQASISILNKNGVTPFELLKSGFLTISRLTLLYDPFPLKTTILRGDLDFFEELLSDFDINCIDKNGNTPLHILLSCKFPDKKWIQFMIDKGADLQIQNQRGFTPLHLALLTHNEDIIELLILADLKNSTINLASFKKVTPLQLATQRQFLRVVIMLLEKGADVMIADDVGLTCLHYAASNGNLELVKLLLEVNPQLINIGSNSQRTSLHLAASGGYLEIVSYLLENGAKLNKDLDGDTPFDDALKSEQPKIFQLLLNYDTFDCCQTYLGRNILHSCAKRNMKELMDFFINKNVGFDVEDLYGCTVIEEALYNRSYEIFKFLLPLVCFEVNKFSKTYGKYPLHAVTCNGRKDLVELFLEKGARTDVVDDEGNTPLHHAIESKHDDIFLILLPSSDYLNIQNKRGETVLHLAVKYGKLELIKTLLVCNVDVDLLDSKGNSAFDLAFNENRLQYIDLLYKMQNFDLDKFNENNKTLLHLAVRNESVSLITFLLKKGASINSKDSNGDTPLHYAAKMTTSLLNLLLSKNKNLINLEEKNNLGETALHLAAETSLENTKLLLNAGACLNSVTSYGATPLFYALSNPSCLRFLWQKTPQVKIFNLTGHMTRTALHLAAHDGDLESTKFLLDVGLKINDADTEGVTPLHEAIERNHLEIVEVMLKYDRGYKIVNVCDGRGRSLLHLAVFQRDFDLVCLLIKYRAKTDLFDAFGKRAIDYAEQYDYKKIFEFLKKC